jgi:hypothetical protein
MIEGGCFCGAVRIAIDDGDYPSVNCHCTMCRRIHAAPYVAWLVVPVDGFHYVSGTPEKLASSEKGARYFCSKCGTQVACVNAGHPEIVDVPVCCLDEPERFPPTSSFFADTRLGWKEDV